MFAKSVFSGCILVNWDDYSQYTEQIQNVPNHHPVLICVQILKNSQCFQGSRGVLQAYHVGMLNTSVRSDVNVDLEL